MSTMHMLSRCWLWKSALATVAALALSGCAVKSREGLQIVPPERAHEIVLLKPIHFAAVSVGRGSTYWYHGLMPGRYKVEATDDVGDYYAGEKDLLIFGASLAADGQVEEPRTFGGFWLARNPNAQAAFRLYRVNPKNTDGSEMPLSLQMGLIPYAIDHLTGNRIGIGVWSWQFVPMVHGDDDLDRVLDAARKTK